MASFTVTPPTPKARRVTLRRGNDVCNSLWDDWVFADVSCGLEWDHRAGAVCDTGEVLGEIIVVKGEILRKGKEEKRRKRKRQTEEAGEDYERRQTITKEMQNCNKLWQSYGASSGMAPALRTQ